MGYSDRTQITLLFSTENLLENTDGVLRPHPGAISVLSEW